MILKNNLYSIIGKTIKDSIVSYQIALDKNHIIYQAHFPNEPITPGVCIIQIAKELLEEHLERSFEITKVKNVKFLSVISPTQQPQVIYELDKIATTEDTGECKVSVLVTDPTAITQFAKISIICKQS